MNKQALRKAVQHADRVCGRGPSVARSEAFLDGYARFGGEGDPSMEGDVYDLESVRPADARATFALSPSRQRHGYSCGPASLAMVLRGHGIDVVEEDLWLPMGIRETGVHLASLASVPQRFGLRVAASSDTTLERLGLLTSAGAPVLCDVASFRDPSSWHIVVAHRVDDEGVHLLDPSAPTLRRVVPAKDFEARWSGWAMVVLPGEKDVRLENPRELSWLTGPEIDRWLALMACWGVSEVARSSRGFLRAYREAGNDPERLSPWWRARRNAFLARHVAQMDRAGESAFEHGLPTRRHLALVAWAYSPERGKLARTRAPTVCPVR